MSVPPERPEEPPQYTKYREEAATHQIEEVGGRLRGLMSWIKKEG